MFRGVLWRLSGDIAPDPLKRKDVLCRCSLVTISIFWRAGRSIVWILRAEDDSVVSKVHSVGIFTIVCTSAMNKTMTQWWFFTEHQDGISSPFGLVESHSDTWIWKSDNSESAQEGHSWCSTWGLDNFDSSKFFPRSPKKSNCREPHPTHLVWQ